MGQKVCLAHGGGAPQNRAAGRRRLEALFPDALQAIRDVINQKDDVSARERASYRLLDRIGYHPTQAVELSGTDGRPVEIATIDVEKLTPELREKLLEIYRAIPASERERVDTDTDDDYYIDDSADDNPRSDLDLNVFS